MPENIQSIVYREAIAYDIDPFVVFAIIKVESNFNPKARGEKGEYGLMQLKCSTAKQMENNVKCHELLKPDINIRIGVKYLRWLIDQLGHDRAIVAYNIGIGRVLKDVRFKSTSYHRKIVSIYRSFCTWKEANL